MPRIPYRFRLARLLWGVSTLSVVFATIASAQTAAPKAAEPDSAPLARYAPRDKLLVLAEFAGLNSYADAWQKTAAYKMLNETTLGAMLEDMGAQLAEKLVSRRAERKISGTEAVAAFKHLLHAGFLFAQAGTPDDPKTSCSVFVIRGGASKESKALFSRVMLTLGGADAKAEIGKRPNGQVVVVMKSKAPGKTWAWWPDGENLVIAIDRPESADVVSEVVAGKSPSAVEHPSRVELCKDEDGFQPVGWAFLDTTAWPAQSAAATFFGRLQVRGVGRIDYRWGLAGNAVMTVTRIQAPKPRQGLLALFDQPTFDAKTMLSMPAEVTAFTALSVNPSKSFDTISSLVKVVSPGTATAIDGYVENLRVKNRLQLRKDVLARLGPRMVFYLSPSTAAASTKAASEKRAAPDAAKGMLSLDPLSMLTAGGRLPKMALLAEIDDPVAFGRSIDTVMIVANQQLRARASEKAAEKEPNAANADGGSGGERGDAGERKRSTDKVPAPEFARAPGTGTSYVFFLPSELGKLPPGVRPTIRVGTGTKYVAIASSPDLARQALELKKDSAWTAPPDLAAQLEKLPPGLILLNVDDPKEKLPKLLAGLPGELQKGMSLALAQSQMKAQPAAGTASRPGSGSGSSSAGAGNSSATPSFPGAYGGSGGSGQPAANAAAGDESAFQFQIDPAKLPSADALSAFFFQGTLVVSSDDKGIEFVRRQAFPNLIVPLGSMAMAVVYPAIQKARGLPGAPPGAAVPGAAGTPTTSAPNSSAPSTSAPSRDSRRER